MPRFSVVLTLTTIPYLCLSIELESKLADLDAQLSSFQETMQQLDSALQSSASALIESSELEGKYYELIPQVAELEKFIEATNVQQLYNLLDKLKEIEEKEVERKDTATVDRTMDVTIDEAQEMFSPEAIFGQSDEELETWIVEQLNLEVSSLIDRLSNDPRVTKVAKACVSHETAANQVQSALVQFSQDGIGRYDHARHASIVHTMTSDTYTPPTESSQRLSSVWWRRLIPEDWEDVLPAGWMDWDAGIPSYLAHTLGWHRASGVAPPEAILHPATHPGACWPMQGTSGHVTLRLSYPVAVDAITIDHTPALLLVNKEDQLKSAPKKLKIFGYAPCSNCAGLGFDRSSRTLLVQFEYDQRIGGVQTFPLDIDSDPLYIGSDDDDDDFVATAIEAEIDGNWGNEEYTCLYRLRVHGRALEI